MDRAAGTDVGRDVDEVDICKPIAHGTAATE